MPEQFSTDIYRMNQPKGPEQIGPMQALQMLGQLNQNKLFQQTYGARENIGNAYRDNVNPDGTMNSRGLAKDIAGKGGFLAGEALGTGIANATNQAALDKTNIQYAQQSLGALATKKDLKPSDLANWGVTAKRAGVPADVVDSMIDGAYGAKDPKKFLATQGILSLGAGAMEPAAGPFDPEKGATPEVSRGEAVQNRILGTTPKPSGTFTTAPANYGENLAQMNQERKVASDFKTNAYPIESALDVYAKHGPDFTGPLTSELNTVQTFAKSFFPNAPWVDSISREKISDYEKLQKMFSQIALSQGPRSDMQLGTASTANPNTKLSSLGGQELSSGILGLMRYNIASIMDADKRGITPDKYPKWKSSEWSNQFDPRAFYIDKMSPEKLGKLEKMMKPDELKKFNKSVGKAIELGLVPDPNQQ